MIKHALVRLILSVILFAPLAGLASPDAARVGEETTAAMPNRWKTNPQEKLALKETLRPLLFQHAVKAGTKNHVQAWLDCGIDPNTKINDTTMLGYAILRNADPELVRVGNRDHSSLSIVETLLAGDAKPNWASTPNETPTFRWSSGIFSPVGLAAILGCSSIIKKLVAAGAKVNDSHGSWHSGNDSPILWNTRVAIPSPNYPAAARYYWHTIRTLLHSGMVYNSVPFLMGRLLPEALSCYELACGKETGNLNDEANADNLPWHMLLPPANKARVVREALEPVMPSDLTNIVLDYADYHEAEFENKGTYIREALTPFAIRPNITDLVVGYAGCMDPDLERCIRDKAAALGVKRNAHVVLNKAAEEQFQTLNNQMGLDFSFASPIIAKFLGKK